MKIDVKLSGLKELQAELKDFSERRIKAVTATTLTRTTVVARDAVKANLLQVVDRPKPYTTRQVMYVGASANQLTAAVGLNIAAVTDIAGSRVMGYRDLGDGERPAGKYLGPLMAGGQRQAKAFENMLRSKGVLPNGWYVVPGQRAKVDAYGNQSAGEIRQILSWFDAAERTLGSTQNMGMKGRQKRMAGTRTKAGWEYFVVQPGAVRTWSRSGGGAGSHKMQPGIYRRTSHSMGNRIEPVMIFVQSAKYRATFDFYGVAHRTIDSTWRKEWDRAVAEHRIRLLSKG